MLEEEDERECRRREEGGFIGENRGDGSCWQMSLGSGLESGLTRERAVRVKGGGEALY